MKRDSVSGCGQGSCLSWFLLLILQDRGEREKLLQLLYCYTTSLLLLIDCSREEMLLMTWHETSSWDENEAVNVTDISWIQGEGKWSGFECFFLLYLFFQLRRDENRWDEQEKKNLSLESCLCLALTASDCNTMCSVSLFTCEVNALNSQFECVCREEREREEVMEEGFSYVPSVSQHLRHQQEILCHEVPFFSWRRRRKSKKLISLVFVVCVWVSCKRQREKEEIQGQNQDHKRYVRVFQEW